MITEVHATINRVFLFQEVKARAKNRAKTAGAKTAGDFHTILLRYKFRCNIRNIIGKKSSITVTKHLSSIMNDISLSKLTSVSIL